MFSLKIGTYNVRGLGDSAKRRKIFHYLHKREYDLVFVQESHSTKNAEKFWRSQWGGRIIFSHGSSASKGVLILIKKKVQLKEIKQMKDKCGRWIIWQAQYNDKILNFVNIYAPNEDNPQFFVELFNELAKVDSKENGNYILGGDLNMVFDLELDKEGGLAQTNTEAQKILLSYCDSYKITDIWRYYNRDIKRFTWRRLKPNPVKCRLDYLLISDALMPNISNVDIAPSFLSDHSIPNMMLSSNLTRGPGFWRLNTSLLDDKDYQQEMVDIIQEQTQKDYDSDILRWEMIKLYVRMGTIQFASSRSKSIENKLRIYEQKVSTFEKQLDNNEFDTEIFSEEQILKRIEELKSEIQIIMDYKTAGAVIRTRSDWLEFGEKSSKYFFNLEQNIAARKNRFKLRDNTGITSDPKRILEIQRSYYAHLFKSSNTKIDEEYLASAELPTITNEQQELCNRDINLIEIKEAIEGMKNNKSPGSDGIPIEWYKTFWENIKWLLLSVMREISRYGLPESSRSAVITLIEKKDKDLLDIKNWRPLSLLNCDYKIYAKILANRLYSTLPNLISKDQFGFLADRYIGENIFDVNSIIEYCKQEEIPALLINLDMEKAFDKVEYKPLLDIMRKFGFQSKYISMVEMLFTSFKSCTVNLGYSSSYFAIERSLKQGCPYSPPAYLLIAEILNSKINANHQIEGILIPGQSKEKKCGQFADDTWASIKANEKSFKNFFKELNKFTDNTGLKVNYNKTQILRIGSSRNSDAKFYSDRPLIWTDKTTILGINVTADTSELIQNYDLAIEKIDEIFNLWKYRGMSVIGKIQIINSLVASVLVYKMSCLPSPPAKFFKSLRGKILKFLWDGKPAKISYKNLIQNIECGGLKLVDLEAKDKALKIVWIKRLYESEATWSHLAKSLIKISPTLIISCNLKKSDLSKTGIDMSYSMWNSILSAWCDYNFNYPDSASRILQQNLWFNSHIKSNEQILKFSELQNTSIRDISDIYDIENRCFKTFEQVRNDELVDNNKDFLVYYKILNSIPKTWKNMLQKSAIWEFTKVDYTEKT